MSKNLFFISSSLTLKMMKLDELLLKDANEILLSIDQQRLNFLADFHKENVPLDHFLQLMKVLSKLVTSTSSAEILNQLLVKVLSSPMFTLYLPQVVSGDVLKKIASGEWTREVGVECVTNLMRVLLACYDRLPNVAYDRVHLVVTALETLTIYLDDEKDSDFRSLYHVSSFQPS